MLVVGLKQTIEVNISPSDATNQKVTWVSSNSSIATVSGGGEVTGVSPGEAIITAKTENDKTATCKVDVVESSECDIISFIVNGISYHISNLMISYHYNKIAENTWNPPFPSFPVTPIIQVSPKASYSPTWAVDFYAAPVTYTVTAGDGVTKKTYIVIATRQETL